MSLLGNIGCAMNESWAAICSLPVEACIWPARPPPGYTTPWVPPPLVTTTYAMPTDISETTAGPTTKGLPYACLVPGADCGLRRPVVTTTASWGAAQSGPGDGQRTGDPFIRIPEGASASGVDLAMYPPTTTAQRPEGLLQTYAPFSTMAPPEWGDTTTIGKFSPSGWFANLWGKVMPDVSPGGGNQPQGSSPKGSVSFVTRAPSPAPVPPGVYLARSRCVSLQSIDRDPYEPPAGKVVCGLQAACMKLDTIKNGLYGAIICGALEFVLVIVYAARSRTLSSSADDNGDEDPDGAVPASAKPSRQDGAFRFISFFLILVALIALCNAVFSALSVDMAYDMNAPGAICAILAMVLALLGVGVAAGALAVGTLMGGDHAGAEEARRAAIQVAWAEGTLGKEDELWKDTRAEKKVSPRGWRPSKAVSPPEDNSHQETVLAQALEAPPESSTRALPMCGGGSPRTVPPLDLHRISSSSLSEAEEPSSPQALVAFSPPRLSEEAMSSATQASLQRFFHGEGAVYAAALALPHAASAGALTATAEEPTSLGTWESRVSRSTGATYYVNQATGESRWREPTPPSSPTPQGLQPQSPDEPGFACVPMTPDSSAPVWKTKRTRSGQVYSVRSAW